MVNYGRIDPWDGKDKSDGVLLKTPSELTSIDQVFDQYKRIINYYTDISTTSQAGSFKVMNKLCSFTMVTLLSDSCLERERTGLHELEFIDTERVWFDKPFPSKQNILSIPLCLLKEKVLPLQVIIIALSR